MAESLGGFELGRVHCGDALELLKRLPDGCVDAVVTDPPYGVGMHAFDDNYEVGLAGLIQAPGRLAAVFHSPRRVVDFASRASGWTFERLLWMHKTADIAAPWRGWCMNSEAIIIMSRDRAGWPTAEDFRSDCYSVGPWERSGHPNGKPLWVVVDLVRRLTLPGQVVLDPFSGAGTVAIACAQLGRRFLGFELDPHWCQVANDRIAAAQKGLTVAELKQGQGQLFGGGDA